MPRTSLAALAAAAALSWAAAPAAAACAAARVAPSVASLPDPWRQAVEALARASGTEGHPWSCTGGVIDLVVQERGAILTVVSDDGRAISREVTAPEDIAPLGQALLAKPLLPPRPGPVLDSPAPRAPDLPPPRALVSALLAPRYAGGANLVWGGLTAAISVPFGAWGAGAWARYDGLYASLDHGKPMHEICFGATASRSFALRAVELRASVQPSVAIVTQHVEHGVDETHVDGRIGIEARGVIPFTSRLRGVVALDADLAPAELDDHHDHDAVPTAPFPAYTLGLGIGLELALR